MKKILIAILIVASIWSSEHSGWSSEGIELQQESRLPSPQRGRGVGGEGWRGDRIGRLPIGLPQTSLAQRSLVPRIPRPQLLSALRERRGAESSVLPQAASRNREGFLPGARVLLDAIFISLLEAYASLWVSPAQAVIVSFVALILTLLFRPTGLFVPTPK